jgi:hypothetical protein
MTTELFEMLERMQNAETFSRDFDKPADIAEILHDFFIQQTVVMANRQRARMSAFSAGVEDGALAINLRFMPVKPGAAYG